MGSCIWDYGYMASRNAKLREREEQMIRACEAANNHADVLAIERDWEALVDNSDRIVEPWNNAPPR